MAKSQQISFKVLSAGNTVLELCRPFVLEPQYEEQEVILEYPAFHIIASGASREEVRAVFEEHSCNP